MPDDFSPTDLLTRMLRYWPLVAVMMIAGGLTAWAICQARPALYESQAVITFSFNLARTGALTEKDEDYAMGAAATIMSTNPVSAAVVESARRNDILLPANPLNQSVFLERKSFRLAIRVRLPDAQAAAWVANAWAQRAYQELSTAAGHAEKAETLRIYQDSLVGCLNQLVVTGPVTAECPLKNLADVQRELQAGETLLAAEKAAARGFMPFLVFNPPDPAVPAARPAQFDQNALVLAGIMIGFVLSILVIASDLPHTLALRLPHAAPRAQTRP